MKGDFRKKLVIGLLLISSVSAFAETIRLKGGESIYLNGTVVKCEGSNPVLVGNARFADLPTSNLINILAAGLGSCKITYTSGSNRELFYSSSHYSSLHVNPNTIGYIKDDIRNGNCD